MPTEFTAQVIAAFGRQVRVRSVDGEVHAARPFGRRLGIVCGDRVRCTRDERHGAVHVVEVLQRASALYRSNARGGSELVVANLDLLAIVVASRPEPDFFVADRYVAAAESAGIATLLVLNKCDLEVPAAARAELDAYGRCGYRIVQCSARSGCGLDALRGALAGHTAFLAGQSGVGKSSLIGALLPAAQVETGELSREREGRHTTTASHLYDLDGDAHLIDSPGVRDFAPAVDRLEPRTLGFREIAQLAPHCRFADCQHLQEPQCVVRAAAAADGAISPRRYQSYRRLRQLYEELRAARGPRRAR